MRETSLRLKGMPNFIEIPDENFKGKVISCYTSDSKKNKFFARRFFLDREPRYYFERLGGSSLAFIKRTKDNQLRGMFKNGHLVEKDEEIEQIYSLSKFDLIPNYKRIGNTELNGETSSQIDTCDNNYHDNMEEKVDDSAGCKENRYEPTVIPLNVRIRKSNKSFKGVRRRR